MVLCCRRTPTGVNLRAATEDALQDEGQSPQKNNDNGDLRYDVEDGVLVSNENATVKINNTGFHEAII